MISVVALLMLAGCASAPVKQAAPAEQKKLNRRIQLS